MKKKPDKGKKLIGFSIFFFLAFNSRVSTWYLHYSDYLNHISDFVGDFHLQQLPYPEPTNQHSFCLFPFVVSSVIFNQNHYSKNVIRIRKNTHLFWVLVFNIRLNVFSISSCTSNPLWLCLHSVKVFLIQVKMIPLYIKCPQCFSAFNF